jgi:hypothetical protein
MRGGARYAVTATTVLTVTWHLGDGSDLCLLANLAAEAAEAANATVPTGETIYRSEALTQADLAAGRLPPWSVLWRLQRGERS